MKTTVYVKLEITASPEDAFGVVDQVLDEGTFQEAINELVGRDRVTSAISGGYSHVAEWVKGR